MKENRFSLSKEQFAKERVKVIKETLAEFQKQYPEILSLCLYGSTVKGYSTPDSDIDGVLFIDITEIMPDGFTIDEGTMERKGSKEPYSRLIEINIDNCMEKFRDALRLKLPLSFEQTKHLDVLPISKHMIDTHLEALKGWVNEKATADKYIDKVYPSKNITALFYLETGLKINVFRKYLLEKLSEMKEGENVWKIILENIKFMEAGSYNNNRNYPETLDEAVKTYAK